MRHDVIAQDKVMFNPAQRRLLKRFAVSSLLMVVCGESAA
jgi:hypothetical protein